MCNPAPGLRLATPEDRWTLLNMAVDAFIDNEHLKYIFDIHGKPTALARLSFLTGFNMLFESAINEGFIYMTEDNSGMVAMAPMSENSSSWSNLWGILLLYLLAGPTAAYRARSLLDACKSAVPKGAWYVNLLCVSPKV